MTVKMVLCLIGVISRSQEGSRAPRGQVVGSIYAPMVLQPTRLKAGYRPEIGRKWENWAM